MTMKKARSLKKNNLKNHISIWLPMSFGFVLFLAFCSLMVTIKYSFKISHCTGLTVSWQVTASQALMNSWS